MLINFDLSQLWNGLSISPYLEKAIYVLLILILVQFGTWLVRKHLQKIAGTASGKAVARLSVVAPSLIWVMGFTATFVVLGGDLNSITEILLAGSLAIGLVITPAGSNIIAGFLNIWNDVFHVGDTIAIKNDEIVGRVVDCGLISTRVITIDNSCHDIPNKVLFDQEVHNYSMFPFYRIVVPIHVDDSNADPRQVKAILEPLLQNDEHWNKVDPANGQEYRAEVRLTEIGPSSFVYNSIAWIEDRLLAKKMQDQLLETCVLALLDAGVSVGQTSNLSGLLNLKSTNNYLALPQEPNRLLHSTS